MAPSLVLVFQQLCTKANVSSNVGIDDKTVSVSSTVGNIIGHVAAIQKIKMHFKVYSFLKRLLV